MFEYSGLKKIHYKPSHKSSAGEALNKAFGGMMGTKSEKEEHFKDDDKVELCVDFEEYFANKPDSSRFVPTDNTSQTETNVLQKQILDLVS